MLQRVSEVILAAAMACMIWLALAAATSKKSMCGFFLAIIIIVVVVSCYDFF